MVKLSAAQKAELFNTYAHALFCKESNLEGTSLSLGALARLGGKTQDKLPSGDRRGKVAEILTELDKSYAQKVLLLEDAARGYYQISRDCEDEGFIKDTMEKLEQVLPLIKADNKQNFETRNKIFNRLYDLDEQLSPRAFDRRFSLLEKMVRDVKQNDGGYDHDPLNTTARRIDYFMNGISAQKRLALLWQIRKKPSTSPRMIIRGSMSACCRIMPRRKNKNRKMPACKNLTVMIKSGPKRYRLLLNRKKKSAFIPN